MIILVLVIGTVVGFGGGYACFKSQLEVQKVEHKQEKIEAWDEIKRLRTQVAQWVGT